MDGKITWVPLYFFEEYIKVSLLSDSKAGKRYKEFLKTCIDGKTDGEFGDLVARSIEKMEKLREKAKKGAERRWEKPAPSNATGNALGIPPSNATGNADRLEKKREEKKREENITEDAKDEAQRKWDAQFGNRPVSEEQKKEFFAKVGASING